MASKLAREKAAQAWCKPTTEKIVLNSALAEAFAEILDEECDKTTLDDATDEELQHEINEREEYGKPRLKKWRERTEGLLWYRGKCR